MSQVETIVNGAVTGQEVTVAEFEAPAVEPVWTLVSTPEAINGIWHHVEPMLRRSVQWSPTIQKIEGMDDVWARVLNREYELWICTDKGSLIAVLVTQIVVHPLCCVVNINYGAGEQMDRWLKSFADLAIEKARKLGCRFFRVEGRDGWIKPLNQIGFKKVSTTFMLEI